MIDEDATESAPIPRHAGLVDRYEHTKLVNDIVEMRDGEFDRYSCGSQALLNAYINMISDLVEVPPRTEPARPSVLKLNANVIVDLFADQVDVPDDMSVPMEGIGMPYFKLSAVCADPRNLLENMNHAFLPDVLETMRREHVRDDRIL